MHLMYQVFDTQTYGPICLRYAYVANETELRHQELVVSIFAIHACTTKREI